MNALHGERLPAHLESAVAELPWNKTEGLPYMLRIAVGSPVMLTANRSVQHNLVNGSEGVVRSFVIS